MTNGGAHVHQPNDFPAVRRVRNNLVFLMAALPF